MKKYVLSLVFTAFSVCFAAAQEVVLSFDHYAVLVKDLDASTDFYQDVLGLTEIEDKTNLDHIRWFSMGGKTELHVIEKPDFTVADEIGLHFALRVSDLDAFMRRLGQHDIPFKNWFGLQGRTNTRPDGIRQVYLQDPSGYWIEVNGE